MTPEQYETMQASLWTETFLKMMQFSYPGLDEALRVADEAVDNFKARFAPKPEGQV